MTDRGFGSELWRNVQAIKFGKDSEIGAPMRANGKDGIIVGVDQVAAADAAADEVEPEASSEARSRHWWARLTRR